MTDKPKPPTTERLQFSRFQDGDADDLARLLADPEIARNITTNGSTPERCLASARQRIAWHNKAWDDRGYGVWALRRGDAKGGPVIGWCGFAPPDVPSAGPELLYGLARDCWGGGLGIEAARGALDWLFDETAYTEASALIFERLNPHSVRVSKTLGMTRRGTLAISEFLTDRELARDVLDYEIWRLREGPCLDGTALLAQAPYKAGLIASTDIAEREPTERALLQAAQARPDFATLDPAALAEKVSEAFRLGLSEGCIVWFCITRDSWRAKLN
jgi:RimJ/RimL family protein N-acetyltransferase